MVMTIRVTYEASGGRGELGGIFGIENAICDHTEEALLEALHQAFLALLPKPTIDLGHKCENYHRFKRTREQKHYKEKAACQRG